MDKHITPDVEDMQFKTVVIGALLNAIQLSGDCSDENTDALITTAMNYTRQLKAELDSLIQLQFASG